MKIVEKTTISRREMLKLTGGSLAALILVACGGGDGTTTNTSTDDDTTSTGDAPPAPGVTEVVMMYLANEISEDEIAQFNADHSHINLTRIDVDTTRLFAMLASGEAPDLIRTMAPDLPQFRARNIMLPLDDYFAGSSVLNVDDLVEANNYYKLASPTEVGTGPIYGMAKDWAPDSFIWLNEATFEAAGVDVPDWSSDAPSAEEVVAAALAVTTREGDSYTVSGLNMHTGFIDRYWMNLIKAAGSSLYADDFKQINLVGNDVAVEAVSFFHNLAAQGAMNSPINPSADWFGSDFVAGRSAMTYTGYWFHGQLVNDPDEAFQQHLADGKIKCYPHFTWQGNRSHLCVTAAGAVITSGSKNPDAAWEVFEWYMGKEPADARARGGWGLPALTSKFDQIPTDGPLSSQAWQTAQTELTYAEDVLNFNPFLAGGEPMVPGQVFMNNWELLLNEEISFDEMLDLIQTETDLAIREGVDRVG